MKVTSAGVPWTLSGPGREWAPEASPTPHRLYVPPEDLGVISTSLFPFKGPFGAHWGTISAGAVLVVLPTLIVFLFLQRFIRNGLTRAATK